MSKAYICDKCGLIINADDFIRGIWITSPHVRQDVDADMHLCEGCYREFESEYLANLKENGGVS